MALFDNASFNSGWLGNLINQSGGMDNPGWQALSQLFLGPQGGPIDRYLNNTPPPGPVAASTPDNPFVTVPPPQLPPAINVGSLPQGGAGIPQDVNPQIDLPPKATPVAFQGQQPSAAPPPPYPTPQRGGLSDALQGFMANAHTGPIGALLGGIAGAAGMGQGNPQTVIARAVYQSLVPKMPPEKAYAIAQMAAVDPKFAQTILPQALGLNPPKSMDEFIAITAAGEYPQGGGGLQNALQLQAKLKTNETAAAKVGEAQGTAAAGLPATLQHFDQGLATVDDLLKDPNLKYGFGMLGLAAKIPGTPGADIQAKVQQVAGQASLLGLQQMRGIGRINQNEFNAGTNAIARLQTTQSEGQARDALKTLRDLFAKARTSAGVLAGGEPTPPPQAESFSQDQLLAEARRRKLIK